MKKKIITILAAALLSVSMFGCGEDSTNVNTNQSGVTAGDTSSAQEASSAENTGYPQGDQSVIDSFGIEYAPRIRGANYKINTLGGHYGNKTSGGLFGNAKYVEKNVVME